MIIKIDEVLQQKKKDRLWLSNQVGINYHEICDLCNGRTESIYFSEIDRICDVLKCEVSDIFENGEMEQVWEPYDMLDEYAEYYVFSSDEEELVAYIAFAIMNAGREKEPQEPIEGLYYSCCSDDDEVEDEYGIREMNEVEAISSICPIWEIEENPNCIGSHSREGQIPYDIDVDYFTELLEMELMALGYDLDYCYFNLLPVNNTQPEGKYVGGVFIPQLSPEGKTVYKYTEEKSYHLYVRLG